MYYVHVLVKAIIVVLFVCVFIKFYLSWLLSLQKTCSIWHLTLDAQYLTLLPVTPLPLPLYMLRVCVGQREACANSP